MPQVLGKGPHGTSPRNVPASAEFSEIDALGLGLSPPQMMMMITTTISSIILFLAVTAWL